MLRKHDYQEYKKVQNLVTSRCMIVKEIFMKQKKCNEIEYLTRKNPEKRIHD